MNLAESFATSFTVAEQSFRANFVQLLSNPSACIWVAEQQGVVVGYVLGFEHLTFFANGRVAWVEELMVRESQRRKGMGNALMDTATNWAISRECRMVALATRRAADFYTALGYEPSATYFRKLLPGRAKA
jgi:GNAT superfamily N-acetyltransferase